MKRSLQNILIKEKGESLTYVPVNGVGGTPNFPPKKNARSET